ncbi:hypothetical protein V8C86DRAFT_3102635 [Haematococcus lacustris]
MPSAPTTVPSLPGVKEEEEGIAGSREEVLQESAGPSLAVPLMPKPALELEFDWHDIEARLAISPVTGQQVLVLTQQDITQYVTAELEVKQVLDAEHKLLEEIFPRHVLQAMAMRNAASFNSPISLHGVKTTTALPPTPEEQGSSSWKAAGTAQGSGRVGPPGSKPVQTSPDLARHHEAITVLFADITSFTSMCSQLPPTEIMSFLNG